MPSYARKHQLNGSLVYHAYNRSNMRAPIFHTDGDHRHFMKLLKDYAHRFLLEIFHWVILYNHFHILFEIEDPLNIPRLMAGINRAYTHYHHKLYGTSGFLWQGRYKLQPVQKERYLIACGRYIERNPVRANRVRIAQDYPYSSASFYCAGIPDDITREDPTYVRFGLDGIQRQQGYRQFLLDFDTEEEKLFGKLEEPVGDETFKQRLRRVNSRYMPWIQGRPKEIFSR